MSGSRSSVPPPDMAGEPCPQFEVENQAEVRRIAKMLVGAVGLREAVLLLRGAMLEEALARGNGSRHAAARLLGVNRKAIQRLIADLGL